MDPGLERDTQKQKLEEWLGSLRGHTATHLKNVAWGLDNSAEAPCPPGIRVLELLPSKPPQYGPCVDWARCRVPHHQIQFRYEEECSDPTSLEQVDARLPEEQAWKLSRGTGESLHHGGRRYLVAADAYSETPRLVLPTIGVAGTAVPDPWRTLEHGQCHKVDQGRVLTGKFAVWRDPVMCPADVQAAWT